ncbi:MAG: S8 family serine peptidase [Phycisphaeraceae bacterium]
MPRVWTWLGILALSAGAVGVIDFVSAPSPAAAQSGRMLSDPIPPASDDERVGTIKNKIGWTHAKERLGWDMPNGNGVPVGQVEAPFRGGYLANTDHKQLKGTGFIPESGPSQQASGHATTVARHIVGPDAAGQGVKAIHGYEAGDWMGEGLLKLATTDGPTADQPARVFNHSWIMPGHISAPLILRRVDFLIDEHDVLVVCGLDNKPGRVPALLASAYNVISVGVDSGMNTDGLTHIEGEGRCKPEIVAPGGKTSWSAGVVTGCVAALIEYADRMIDEDDAKGQNQDANKSEVVKAVLLAGAHKPAGWAPPEGEPLDRKLGAGVVDIDRSLVMLGAGHAEPDKPTDQRYGWSFAQVESNQCRAYKFTIDKPQGDTTITLVWNRKVLGGTTEMKDPRTNELRTVWNTGAFCPNLELELMKLDREGNAKPVAASKSKVDNVELIHLETLEPGRYEVRVSRVQDGVKEAWDYALAWRIEAGE